MSLVQEQRSVARHPARRLVIPIEDISSSREDVYIGDRLRKSTATSVVLLDADTLACCHFNGCRMFLIRFDLERGSHTILDTIDTTFKGERCETDLMGGDGAGRLVTSNFFQQTCSLYRRDGDRLQFVKDLGYSTGDRVHGVKFYAPDVVAVTGRYDAGGVHFFDCNTLERRFFLKARGLSVQDACFPRATRAIIVSVHGSPQLYRPREIYSSVVHIVDFDMSKAASRVVRKRIFPAAHFDAIAFCDGRVFITDQYNNLVLVLDSETLEQSAALEGYDFAHGLDVNFNMVAASNYGNNTIEIRSLS